MVSFQDGAGRPVSAVGRNDGSYVWLGGTPAQGSSVEETLGEEISRARRGTGRTSLSPRWGTGPRARRPAYDFGWIWQELGLERP